MSSLGWDQYKKTGGHELSDTMPLLDVSMERNHTVGLWGDRVEDP
jgi:hypothetical protein